ncbi:MULTISPECIES: hypothetical protein [unclassified Bradyrhizobium]|uniref:hypothetical protein n=1 Tax=unclassified Bradyrhizobium TaxID=2631580 RepID=UPI0020B3F669|nr:MULTISPECIES: hypothetical protein [unclassified Bradyrhizobium]MCP3402835.1 hypothetical protein [Bradyrhizobium sp. CCGB20]MCP3411311.1 hypothetical protein [Bradyrhizobium sp. CCGB01]
MGLLVQEAFKRDPHGGDLYVFRGKSGQADQYPLARWTGHVALCQAAGARPLPVAVVG